MSDTLKLRGAEPVVPGLALPEAFESLDSRLDATVQLCQLKGSPETQLLGVVTVCQELQRLLKCAFIENGMLASRVEILTRYSTEVIKKMDKKLADAELEHKATKKQLKRIRKRLSKYETLQRKKHQKWWNVSVNSSDYDSFTAMNRSSGIPDLEFMLRVNQIMIDFVEDNTRSELVLPPMGNEERAELAKLASVYKLRCRYGKSVTLAPSTLIKARQSHTPAPGEVDAVLESFAKTYKRMNVESEEKKESETTEEKPSSGGPLELPTSMLTPLSSTTTVNMDHAPSSSATPAPTPPASGLNTPTGGDPASKSLPTNGKRLTRLSVSAMASSQEKAKSSQQHQSESPLPARVSSPLLKSDSLKMAASSAGGSGSSNGKGEQSKSLLQSSLLTPSTLSQQLQQQQQQQRGQQTQTPTKQGLSSSAPTPVKPGGGSTTTLRTATPHGSVGHSTVVASPLIKAPLIAPATPTKLQDSTDTGDGDSKDQQMPSPPKRIRLTRKTAGLLDETS